jgi:exopolysaccharide biosynthesis WecB/TagA/CpsF family protein
MVNRGRESVLGVKVNVVDYEAVVAAVVDAATRRRPFAVTALAVHGVMTGVLDEAHCHRLNHLDMVVPDGQPVRWALNLLHGARLRERVYGPALMLAVCRAGADRALPIYLYGSTGSVIERLRRNLTTRLPGLVIAGSRPSAFRRLTPGEKNEVIEEIRQSGAAITFVGLGCPRQEIWAYEFREALSMPILAVGAAFDFHSGRIAQAPKRMQNWGLEWLFRLSREPRRLWARYLVLNPLYVMLVTLQLLRFRRFEPADGAAPTEEMGYG